MNITARLILWTSAAHNYQEAAQLGRIKYQAGDVRFLDELIAEERLHDAQTEALLSISNATKTAITLHTAPGVFPSHPLQPVTQGAIYD